ncbi:MAG: hypothetical protein QOI03_1531 [Solirubrobacteraceae bacterium]|jgi:hypothetical protein|nr:hypothetical protein [Solirubrobacteraceae bacterium]
MIAVPSDSPRILPANEGYVARLIRQFVSALDDGRIPRAPFRACSPHPTREAILISIYQDDEQFRRAVADLLPPESYEVQIEDVIGLAL